MLDDEDEDEEIEKTVALATNVNIVCTPSLSFRALQLVYFNVEHLNDTPYTLK